ncbi:MAG: NAD-dependent epimerase/dehydratase family protein [Lentisphaeria bacterium]|nr:NAD-dependent epimerase/dehydratase family protein [Lentisphaeria bacterium]
MEQKRILVVGATGAMGQYLVPILAENGHKVDALALNTLEYTHPNLNSFSGDAQNYEFMRKLVTENRYDAIVDFMIYNTPLLAQWLPMMAASTGHYIYLSTYRIYDNKEVPIKETSPRLLDTADDVILRNSDDYSVYKARGENIMHVLPRKNWTIIRPAITYSLMRYQLVTLEAFLTVGRAFAGKPVVLPAQAKDIQGTMSWAGDVAQMISKLLFNERAFGETFTVATAEHHSWGEIADYYKDICGLKTVWVDKEDFLKMLCGDGCSLGARWQLECDRLFTRIMDNSKVLSVTGMKQENLKPLYDGLAYEIGRCPKDHNFCSADWIAGMWKRMDELAEKA